MILRLGVIFRLDLVVVYKVLLLALVTVYLETVAVEGVFVFVPANILDDDLLADIRALVGLGFPMIGSMSCCCQVSSQFIEVFLTRHKTVLEEIHRPGLYNNSER